MLSFIQTGALASTFAYMLSRGLDTSEADLWYLGARPWLLLKSLLTVDLLVPVIALAVIFLVRPARAVAIGLLLLVASPVAPMALKMILKAGGSREYATGLHVILAWLMLVTTPITIEILSNTAGFHLEIRPEAVAQVVGMSILFPITAGVIAGQWLHRMTRQMIRPLKAFSDIVSLLVNIAVLILTWRLLFMLDIRSYLAIALLIVSALAAGHLIARRRPAEQAALALESATGNVGLALLMASTFTTMENALPVIIPYIVISVIICLGYIRYLKRAMQKASS